MAADQRSSTDNGEHEEEEVPFMLQMLWAHQLWRIFICFQKISSMNSRNIEGELKCCIELAMLQQKRKDGRLLQFVCGGHSGKKGIKYVLKERRAIYRILRSITTLCITFDVNKNC